MEDLVKGEASASDSKVGLKLLSGLRQCAAGSLGIVGVCEKRPAGNSKSG